MCYTNKFGFDNFVYRFIKKSIYIWYGWSLSEMQNVSFIKINFKVFYIIDTTDLLVFNTIEYCWKFWKCFLKEQ